MSRTLLKKIRGFDGILLVIDEGYNFAALVALVES